MTTAMRSNLLSLCSVVLLTSCVARRGPEVPSNAAVWFVEAVLEGDSADVRSRSCDAIANGLKVDLDNPATFGAIAGFLELLVGDADRRVGWRGADHQYTAAEELSLEADEAWTEMELRSGGAHRYLEAEHGPRRRYVEVCSGELRS